MTGLGMFSVLKRSLDLGSDRRVYVQRPIFILSEKLAKLHGITYAKYQSPGKWLNICVCSYLHTCKFVV